MLTDYDPPVLSGTHVRINDCTLREGEQSLDVSLTDEDKRRIAGSLSRTGVDSIQLSHAEPDDLLGELAAASSPSETEVLLLGFHDDWKRHLDRVRDAGIGRINLVFRSSPMLLTLLGWTEDELVACSTSAVEYAVAQGLEVAFSPTDGTRAPRHLLSRLFRENAAAGARTVYVCDTLGVAGPAGISTLVRLAQDTSNGAEVAMHCHNDMGLALANALAGCEAGATIVDTCINGVGERTGNPALDEVAVALELMLGATTSVVTGELTELSRSFAELTGHTLSATKPHVSAHAFAQKMDIHVEASLVEPSAYVPYDPAFVGGALNYQVGKKSGPVAVSHALSRVAPGHEIGNDILHAIVRDVQAAAEHERRALTDAELTHMWSRHATAKPANGQ